MRTSLALLGCALLFGVHPALAQGPARAGISNRQSVTWKRSFARDSIVPNEWQKGATIGAGLGLLAGAVFYKLSQSAEGQSAYFFIGPVLIFTLLGGMIGAGSKKH